MKKLSLFTVTLLFCFSKGELSAQGTFVHPGLLHSASDIEQIKQRLSENDSKTTTAFNVLKDSWIANKALTDIWGVTETIKRGISGDENYMNAYRNAAKAYQCALLWKITDEQSWAEKAIYVLNQYSSITTGIGGNTNQSLVPGFIGYQFLNAAELMRDYDGWAQEDFERFKHWMIDVWFTTAQDFLERRHDTVTNEGNWYHYHSNWGLGNALFCVSLGIFADLPDIYNYGMWWIKEGPGNESLYVGDSHPWKTDQGMCGYGWGLIPWFHEDERGPEGYLNQMQESGRDQGHAMAALGLLSYALQSAYNQGDNAFCNLYNPLIPGMAGKTMVAGAAEYVAIYNCNLVDPEDIPYTTNWWMGGLNATGRGQDRPIWQLFVNHYENRMGIPMEYCKQMTSIVGTEAGGGSYGTNSGGFDHTGFGTLMHSDTPVTTDNVPTILSPEIVNGSEIRPYAEMKEVTPGTQLTLRAVLPEDETDTGDWEWEDGVKGQSRDITANTSGIYRLYYTNSNGVRSTQMFCISVYGEGIRATLTPWVEYGGIRNSNTSTFSAVNGRSVTLGADYANWNYVASTQWYDEDGQFLEAGSSYTFQQGNSDQKFTLVLTNQSGVKISQEFTINNSVIIPTLSVDGVEQSSLRAIITPGHDIMMKGKTTSLRYRNGIYTWDSGEHTDSLYFENVQASISRHLHWIDTTSAAKTYEADFDFEVKIYLGGQCLSDGYYKMKDRVTGKYLNSSTMTFELPDDASDSTDYVWHFTWLDKAERYKIQTHDDSAYLNNLGVLSDLTYSQSRSSYDLYLLQGGEEQECMIRTPERYGNYFWETDGNNLICDQSTEMLSDFPFVLEAVDTGNESGSGIQDITLPTTSITLKANGSGIEINTEYNADVSVYNLSGSMIMNTTVTSGRHIVNITPLNAGIYIVRVSNGQQTQTLKFIR